MHFVYLALPGFRFFSLASADFLAKQISDWFDRLGFVETYGGNVDMRKSESLQSCEGTAWQEDSSKVRSKPRAFSLRRLANKNSKR